jgi:potassium-transporting ATPase KdpC subunit
MKQKILITLKLFSFLTLILGILYPVIIFILGQLMFPYKSNGSLIYKNDKLIGSEIIAQQFALPKYFQPRPSAVNYSADNSGGSNMAPTNKSLIQQIKDRIDTLKSHNPDSIIPIPIEIITTSGSGLDPHISPDAALWQVNRIAKARNIAESEIKEIIESNIEFPLLGFLGEKRVNVLKLNIILDNNFK